MTSKHLFLKSIREELRHKVWMIALSLLGNFLAMPVVWLLRYSDVNMLGPAAVTDSMAVDDLEKMIMAAGDMMAKYFQTSMLLAAGVIAIVGAVIVGLEGFRFLQQKSMVDTWHSLPVSRTVLFGAKYVSGLLIWLVPYLLCMLLACLFAGVLMARAGGAGVVPRLLLAAVPSRPTWWCSVSWKAIYTLIWTLIFIEDSRGGGESLLFGEGGPVLVQWG